jgi:hypothetical protein
LRISLKYRDDFSLQQDYSIRNGKYIVDGCIKNRYDENASGWLGVRGLVSRSRKVRTPQGTASANYRGGVASPVEVNLPDQGHRNRQPDSFGVRSW